MMKYILLFIYIIPLYTFAQTKSELKIITEEVKNYEKSGWIYVSETNDNNDNLKNRLILKYNMEREYMLINNGCENKRYIITKSTEKANSLDSAFKIAKTKARKKIAEELYTDIDVTNIRNSKEDKKQNIEASSFDERRGYSINKTTSANIKEIINIYRIYRKDKQGLYEVEVCIAIDRNSSDNK